MDKEIEQAGPSASPSSSDNAENPPEDSRRCDEDETKPPSPNALKHAAADCLNSWICYLQTLNALCASGVRLAQSLCTLSQPPHCSPLASQCIAGWEELARSTVHAGNAVKAHIASAVQDMIIGETFTEADAIRQQEHNQAIVMENIITFINLQYQYCLAGCESLGPLASCPHCHTSPVGPHECTLPGPGRRCESPQPPGRQRSPSPGSLTASSHGSKLTGRGPRSPLHFPLFPALGGIVQRRWSEVAAAAAAGQEGIGEGVMRRWSMPWDCPQGKTEMPQPSTHTRLLPPPGGPPPERSRSATPEPPMPALLPSAEGLAEAIQLLSCRPGRSSIPQTGHPWESHEERLHRRMLHTGRGNWQSVDAAHELDMFSGLGVLTSRKSSSSTDSSSCLSIHSRSTTGSSGGDRDSGGENMRLHSNFYSMWSGSEHLPFLRLPESQEPPDSDTDDPPTENSGIAHFPRPT